MEIEQKCEKEDVLWRRQAVTAEDDETYYCEVDMDEDDAARLMQGHYRECPYYQLDDEYAVVRHQM